MKTQNSMICLLTMLGSAGLLPFWCTNKKKFTKGFVQKGTSDLEYLVTSCHQISFPLQEHRKPDKDMEKDHNDRTEKKWQKSSLSRYKLD